MKLGWIVAASSWIVAGCQLGPTVIGGHDSGTESGSGSGSGSGSAADPPAPTGQTGETGSEPGDSAGEESGSSTGTPVGCPASKPICSLCAPKLDGLACADPTDSCTNGTDLRCACEGGTWSCIEESLVGPCGPACLLRQDCEERNCIDDFYIDFELGDARIGGPGDYDDVEYDIHLVLDGEEYSCGFFLGYDPFFLDWHLSPLTCTPALFLVDDTGIPQDVGVPFFGDEGIWRLLLPRHRFSSVAATVEVDGELIAEGSTDSVRYERLQVGGLGCEPVCVGAHVMVPAI